MLFFGFEDGREKELLTIINEHNCRTQIVTKGVDTKKMMRETLSDTSHRVLFYGHWLDEVRDMGQLLGFELVEEG